MTVPAAQLAQIAVARRLLAGGRPDEARAAIAGLTASPEVRALRERCRDLLLRKALRQAKPAAFAAEAGSDPRFRLALARLGGTEALRAAAADPVLSADDRELAQWATGDLRTGLQGLRRRPGAQTLAEGWLLLLRGETGRALEAFAKARADQPRRASLGEGVGRALGGELEPAEALLRDLGPFPQSAYPATAALLRSLTRHGAGWDPSALRQLLQSGDLAAVGRALAACPPDRAEERAWLLLRRGDLRYATDTADGRVDEDWAQAGGLWPGLRPDALKRRFWRQQVRHEDSRHLADLHRLLAERDPTQAREALLTIVAEIQDGDLIAIDGPWRTCRDAKQAVPQLPAEWLLVWARCMRFAAEARRHGHGVQAAIARRCPGLGNPPQQWKAWKPVFAKLEAELPGEPALIDLKLAVLDCCRERGERRKTLFAALLADPGRRSELLPAWCRDAAQDKRGTRQIAAEINRLHELFAGDLELTLLHFSVLPDDAAVHARLLAAMPSDHAALAAWSLAGGPVPADLPGRDELVDTYLLRLLPGMGVHADAVRQALWKQPERLPGLLVRLAGLDRKTEARDEAELWIDSRPSCWQAHYALGRLHAPENLNNRDAFYDQAEEWVTALRLDPPADNPAAQEMRAWFAAKPGLREEIEYDLDEVGDGDEDDDLGKMPGLDMAAMMEALKRMTQRGRKGGFGARIQPPPKPKPPKRQQFTLPKPKAPPIDLDHLARAVGCLGALDLADLPVLRELTRSDDGPGPYIHCHAKIRDEVERFNRFADYLRPQLTNPAHRAWLEGLRKTLAKPEEPSPF